MTAWSDRLRQRRCMGFRVAFLLGILLAVINRTDRVLLVIALAGLLIIAVVYWRDCRRSRRTS